MLLAAACFELTEEQKIDIELKRLDAIRKKVELTRFTHNEVRSMIDPTLEELSEDQGGGEVVVLQASAQGQSWLVSEFGKGERKP